MCLSIALSSIRNGRKTKEQRPNWRESPVSAALVVELMRNRLFPFLTQQSEIIVYGKTIRSGNTFYCNPSYGVIGAAKQDWCFVKYDDCKKPPFEIPFHMLLAFRLLEVPTTPIDFLGTLLENSGYYALGHYACEKLTDDGDAPYNGFDSTYGNRAHRDQYLVHRIPKWSESADADLLFPASHDHPPTLCCISCDSIAGPCVAFPDIYCSEPSNNFFFLKPAELWGQLFVDEAYKF